MRFAKGEEVIIQTDGFYSDLNDKVGKIEKIKNGVYYVSLPLYPSGYMLRQDEIPISLYEYEIFNKNCWDNRTIY